MTSEDQQFKAPSLWFTMLEGRTFVEFGAYLATQPILSRLQRGDGHPVLVLPWFIGSDLSTLPLRRVLDRLGYEVAGWDLGRNIGPSEVVVMGLRARLLEMQHDHGRKVSIIGTGLGGLYARHLADRYPNAVRQVITVAAPIRMRDEDRSGATKLYDLFGRFHDPKEGEWRPVEHLDVPATAIYSRSDGIVDWRSCLVEPGPEAENVEVISTHIGMGHNPAAVYAIGDRLAQPEDDWRPFRSGGQLARWFPKPSDPQ